MKLVLHVFFLIFFGLTTYAQTGCGITNVKLIGDGSCDPMNNKFTQIIEVTYADSRGMLTVNDSAFAVTSSPQRVAYVTNSSKRKVEVLVSFDKDSICGRKLEIQVPENCCPYEVKLDSIYYGCVGSNVVIKAEKDLGFYNWFDNQNKFLGSADSVTVSSSGYHTLNVTSVTGCPKTAEFYVDFRPNATISLPSTVSICENINYNIDPITDGISYEWFRNGVKIPNEVNKTLTTKLDGLYTFYSFFNPACKVKSDINITRKVAPKPKLGEDFTLCEGEKASLNINEVGSVQWFRDNKQILGQFTKSLNVFDKGVYAVNVRGSNDCIGTDTIVVDLITKPSLNLKLEKALCEGQSSTLSINTNGIKPKWFFNNGLLLDTLATKTIQETGKYKVIVSNPSALQCSNSDSLMVAYAPTPILNLPNLTSICVSDTLSGAVLSTPSLNGYNYSWIYNGLEIGKSNTIKVISQGLYILKATSDLGCSNMDTARVEHNNNISLKLSLLKNEPCIGDTAVILASNTSSDMKWFFNNNLINTGSNSLKVVESGKYKVLLSSANQQCSATDSLSIVFSELPQVELNDSTNCDGLSYLYKNPLPQYEAEWKNNITNSIVKSQSFTVSKSGNYTLKLNKNGFCKVEKDFNTVVNTKPDIEVQDTIGLCLKSLAILKVKTNGIMKTWRRGNGIIAQNIDSISVGQAGLYIFSAFDTSGICPTSKVISVVEKPTPIFDLGVDTLACDSLIIKPKNNLTGTNNWTFMQNRISANSSIVARQSGKYFLTNTNDVACSSTDSISINILKTPFITLLRDTNLLCGDEKRRVVINTDATSLQWFFNGQILANQNQKELVIDTGGLYSVVASINGACPISRNQTVIQLEAPSLQLGNDSIICSTDSVVFNIPIQDNTIKWNDGSTSSKYVARGLKEPKIIFATVMNKRGCEVSDTVLITPIVNKEFILKIASFSVCLGDTIEARYSGGNNIKWIQNDNDFKIDNAKVFFFPKKNTTYQVVDENLCNGKKDTTSYSLKVISLPDPIKARDTCVKEGTVLKIVGQPGFNYVWQPEKLLTNNKFSTVSLSVTDSLLVTLKISDVNGCEKLDSIFICVKKNPSKDKIIPINVITPNDDAINDVLEFDAIISTGQNLLTVFNRWGSIVYEKKNYQWDDERFDGKKNGEELPADVYYYVLKFDEFEIKSSLTIINEK